MKRGFHGWLAGLWGVVLAGAQAEAPQPPTPSWQTDARHCAWHWREGGGLGLWTETCHLSTGAWEVTWDEPKSAFVLRHQGQAQALAVQPWPLPGGDGMEGLTRALVAAGALAPEAPCHWQTIAHRPAPRTVAFWALVPNHPQALAATEQGEVPEPACGAYGASTHGVRYFIVDLRWAGMAVFVEEGQERPIFDPTSIVRLR